MLEEKHTVLCELCSAKDAECDDGMTTPGEKAVAAAKRAAPAMRFLMAGRQIVGR